MTKDIVLNYVAAEITKYNQLSLFFLRLQSENGFDLLKKLRISINRRFTSIIQSCKKLIPDLSSNAWVFKANNTRI